MADESGANLYISSWSSTRLGPWELQCDRQAARFLIQGFHYSAMPLDGVFGNRQTQPIATGYTGGLTSRKWVEDPAEVG